VVFLAYLNGHQSHFRMLGGAEARGQWCISPSCCASRRRRAAGRSGSRGRPHASGACAGGNVVSRAAEATPLDNADRLSFNQATAERASLAEVVDACARGGVPAISIWRHKLAETGVDRAARLVRDAV